jgi:hypothetical protein
MSTPDDVSRGAARLPDDHGTLVEELADHAVVHHAAEKPAGPVRPTLE